MTTRTNTSRITLGGVAVGGGAPVSVQTMTKTDTRDVAATVAQIKSVAGLGCDIVRLAVPDMEAAHALRDIRRESPIPIVADIHFDHRLAIASAESGVDALRINPGNIGGRANVREVVASARDHGLPIRIGVNSGSVEKDLLERYGGPTPEALVESAMRHVAMLEDEDFHEIKISVKASDVPRTLAAYRLLASRTSYPLHLGVTEAGTLLSGAVRSAAAMGMLLMEGIGDTIRVSLTAAPEQEVRAGLELLRCLGMRAPGPMVTSCPTCGRTQVDVAGTAAAVEARLEAYYRENPNAPRPHVAVMGCVVNGPGEAKHADIAVAGGKDVFMLYRHGEQIGVIPAAEAVDRIVEFVKEFKA